jgi:hypothetical protein
MDIYLKEGYEKQGQIIVHNGGKKEGVQVYRVNGYKKDLLHIIDTLKELGATFKKDPVLEKTHPVNFFSVLLEINLDPIGVGYYEKNTNTNEQNFK